MIEIETRQVAVYNIHLLPPRRFDWTREHRAQFADLLDRLRQEPLPLILGGDFNSAPATPNVAALRGLGLIDSHRQAGRGRGATWPVRSFFRWLPGLRLDYIWLGRGMICTECRRGVGEGSDHRPIIARIALDPRPKE